MTRDQFTATLKQAIEYGRSTVTVQLAHDQLVAHDAEQRAMIEQQVQEIARLRAALEGMLFIFGHNDGYAQVKTAKQVFKKE